MRVSSAEEHLPLPPHWLSFSELSGFTTNARSEAHTYSAKGSFARAEHLVAWFELSYLPANRFNLAGHINAESRDRWFAQPGHYANEVACLS